MPLLEILRYALAAIFAGVSLLQLAGPRFIRAEFEKWNYPQRFRLAVGVYELIGVALLLMPSTVTLGICWLVLLMFGAIYTHVKTPGQLPRIVLPIFVMAMLLALFLRT